MVEQTIWLWFGWDCFIAHRGFIIIERTDSWKRQQCYPDSFKNSHEAGCYQLQFYSSADSYRKTQ